MKPAERHERTDASPGLAVLLAAAVALGVAACLLAGRVILAAGSRPAARPLGEAGLFRHGPEERTEIEEEWPKLSVETREHLATYGWVDRPAGIVRIPIEQAMARLAAGEKPAGAEGGSP